MTMPSLSESQHNSAHRQKVKSGRGWILAIGLINAFIGAGLTFLGLKAQEEGAGDDLFFTGVGMAIIGLIFLGCWLWAKRHPFPAAVTALLIYIALQVATIAVEPSEAVRGILFKALFLVGLASAVQSAYKLKKSGY